MRVKAKTNLEKLINMLPETNRERVIKGSESSFSKAIGKIPKTQTKTVTIIKYL